MNARDILLDIFKVALSAVHGRTCVRSYLATHSLEPISQPIYLIAIGKAAVAMSLGAVDFFGKQIVDGLIITKRQHDLDAPFFCIDASHPIPDESSLLAGKRLLDFIQRIPPSSQILFLLSGGASALVEVLPKSIDLKKLQALHTYLLTSGLSTKQMSEMRAQYSEIKGGKLVRYLEKYNTLQLIISDVPSNCPEEVGSGLLFPSDEQIETAVIATLVQAKHAAATYACQLGFDVDIEDRYLTGEATIIGKNLAQLLLTGKPRLIIRGGEPSVKLPDQPKKGGRNKHLALSAAQVLKGQCGVYLLSCGTDGTDGPCDDTGALVDGHTISRGQSAGFDPSMCLQEANAADFLRASGDLVFTGPTGTNVMDLILGLKINDSL